jgi:hypothetical protein
MRYISVECEYFSAKFVPNPALLPKLFLSEAMSIHSGRVDEQGKGRKEEGTDTAVHKRFTQACARSQATYFFHRWPAVIGYQLVARLQAQPADEYADASAERFDLVLLDRKPVAHRLTPRSQGVAAVQPQHLPDHLSQELAAPVKARSALSTEAA